MKSSTSRWPSGPTRWSSRPPRPTRWPRWPAGIADDLLTHHAGWPSPRRCVARAGDERRHVAPPGHAGKRRTPAAAAGRALRRPGVRPPRLRRRRTWAACPSRRRSSRPSKRSCAEGAPTSPDRRGARHRRADAWSASTPCASSPTAPLARWATPSPRRRRARGAKVDAGLRPGQPRRARTDVELCVPVESSRGAVRGGASAAPEDCDAVIQAAAPADFTPGGLFPRHKIKKTRRGHGARAQADDGHRRRAGQRASARGRCWWRFAGGDARISIENAREQAGAERTPIWWSPTTSPAPARASARTRTSSSLVTTRFGARTARDAEVARSPTRFSTRWPRCSRASDALRGGDRRPVRRGGRPAVYLLGARRHGGGCGLAGRGAVRAEEAGGLRRLP